MKIGWATDLHFNRMKEEDRDAWLKNNSRGVDKWLLTGDISGGEGIRNDFSAIERAKETFYVLGNHDYYYSNFASVKRRLQSVGPNLVYLTESEPIELSRRTVLIGDDGWYDARIHVPLTNWVFSIDWLMIKNFWLEDSVEERLALIRQLSWESTERLVRKVRQVKDHYKRIILATHFPPWRQHHRYKLFDRFWTPYNTNHYLGESLKILFEKGSSELLVLSGHTHIERSMRISDRIKCLIGSSRRMKVLSV